MIEILFSFLLVLGLGLVYHKALVGTALFFDKKLPKKYEEGGKCFLAIKKIKKLAPVLDALESVNQKLAYEFKTGKRKKLTQFFIVGGMLRDLINGNKDPHDLDIACAGDTKLATSMLIELLRNKGHNVSDLIQQTATAGDGGRTHTIYTFKFNGELIEVAPFRSSESYNEDGTLAEVELRTTGYSSWDELYDAIVFDAKRRDFTVNTLYLNPGTQELISLGWKDGSLYWHPEGCWGSNSVFGHIINKYLYRVSPDALTNDPARIWRIIKFILRGYSWKGTRLTSFEINSLFTAKQGRAQGTILDCLKQPKEFVKAMAYLIWTPSSESHILDQMAAFVEQYNEFAKAKDLKDDKDECNEVKAIIKGHFREKPEKAREHIPLSRFVSNPQITVGTETILYLFSLYEPSKALILWKYLYNQCSTSELSPSLNLYKQLVRIIQVVTKKPVDISVGFKKGKMEFSDAEKLFAIVIEQFEQTDPTTVVNSYKEAMELVTRSTLS